ncbi:IS21 family transposase [Sporolactobacillus sp. STCC-11]|uniref:IS21 family transposase n=1 Tax=Sporolactobacillus caesalpiniae TaxID=3230362 RepID=UPI00339A0885
MIKYREILRLHAQDLSHRSIASSCSCSKNTVGNVLKQAGEKGVSWPLEKDMDDSELQDILFPEKHQSDLRKQPDCSYLHQEMARSGVTLSLLWHEYVEACRQHREIPYSYRQFCRFYTRYVIKTKATMRIKRKPGEAMEVDWTGQTVSLKDSVTGQIIPAYVFVSVLPCSQYAYVEAFLSMNTQSWITAHIHALKFFGGVPRMIIPDNLKTGVDRSSRTEPAINRTYQEMAEHYQTAIIPARVRHPKDKPNVEGAVKIISTWIIASLRNGQYFSIIELNQAIREKLVEYNEKPFQKKEGNRQSAFAEEEKFALLPLPSSPYELATWKKATVPYDYHISVEKMYYSVPYEYMKHQVDVRVTRDIIEAFYNNFRIASHIRLYGKQGQLSTNPDHMPDQHKDYLAFNKDYFISWAEAIGIHTFTTVKGLLASYKVEKQALKSCSVLTKLADQYSVERLERACERALNYSPRPNLNSIKTILKTGQDQHQQDVLDPEKLTPMQGNSHGFVRGAAYYGRKEE